ncbi:MAG: DUF5110 domain-containing protein [Bacteroidetes bacterium]|nr:DUF5110 domain-containing protein [Bacteroidota bacterium]
MLVYGLILLIGAQLGFNGRAAQNTTPGKLVKVEKSRNELAAYYQSGQAKLELFKPGIVHLSIERDSAALKSFAVIESPENLTGHKVKATGRNMGVDLPDGTIEFMPGSMKLSFKDANGKEVLDLEDIQFSDSGVVARFDIHGARNFYGLGEKTLPYNKYGSKCTMWNTDFPAYPLTYDPLYESIPFLLKADPKGAYGLFFDNPSRASFDIGATDSSTLAYSASKGAFQLYIVTGKDPAQVVERFSQLTGKMNMPPIWALGYQQSRWSYYPEQTVLNLAHGFRKRNIPCDVIYLDINYMDGYRCFTWSPKDFPTPKPMLDTLHDLGFKVVTIIDPGIKADSTYGVYESGLEKGAFVREPSGKYFVGDVWPGACVFPDFLNKKAREWWGNQYKPLLAAGVDGMWNDMNEPSVFNTPNKTFPLNVMETTGDGENVTHAEVHNVYGMQMARATREGLERLEPDKRPFVLTRSNYAGGQRYSAMWTGDNVSSYAHLKLALTMFLNIGVSGQPFVGSDVGGFVGNPSPELFSRWLELGVFTPFFRTHSTWGSKPREPWAFGAKYTKLNREIIDRRYELLPEIYTAFRNAHLDGLPIVRPLYLDYPDDNEAYKLSDEFMFGGRILVAPVLDSAAVQKDVYLPGKKWLSFYNGKELDRGWHKVEAPLGHTPVFVKDGTILFTQSVVQSTSEQADTLILRVYAARRSADGSAYFDDGETYAYRNGGYFIMNVFCKTNGTGGSLNFKSEGSYHPGYKYVTVRICSAHRENISNMAGRIAVMKTGRGKTEKAKVERMGESWVEFTFPFSANIESITF